jgi:hypothetical protein
MPLGIAHKKKNKEPQKSGSLFFGSYRHRVEPNTKRGSKSVIARLVAQLNRGYMG